MTRAFDPKCLDNKGRWFNATYNNYTQEVYEQLQVCMLTQGAGAPIVWIIAKEHTEATGTRDPAALALGGDVQGLGTPHLQVGIGYANSHVLRAVITKFPQGGHWEAKYPNATPRQVIGYPCKGESLKFHKKTNADGKCPQGKPSQAEEEWTFEHKGEEWEGVHGGVFPVGQGKNPGHDDMIKEIMEGTTNVDEILLGDQGCQIYTQYGRAICAAQDLRNQKVFRTEPTVGWWYYGDTGKGKSHYAFKDYSPATHFVVNGASLKNGGFWCGYKGQETVILNEFRGDLPFGELMDLVDKWPKTVNVKCSQPVPFLAKKFIITTPVSPELTYKRLKITCQNNNDGKFDQLYRRFNVVSLVGTREPAAKRQRIQIDVGTGHEENIEPEDVEDLANELGLS